MREQPGHVQIAGAQQGSDPDAAAERATELVDVLAGLVELGDDASGAGGDREPGLGRRDAAARALEQRDAQLAFEPAHLVRQRGLGEVQLLGGAREVPVAGDRLDAPQLSHVHAIDRRW
jgi:hypothetical protein